jgi:hypothetical protein
MITSLAGKSNDSCRVIRILPTSKAVLNLFSEEIILDRYRVLMRMQPEGLV